MLTTVTTLTTITTIATLGLIAALGIVCIVSLTLFLTAKELASARTSGASLATAGLVNIGILPLVLVLAVIAAVEIAEVLA